MCVDDVHASSVCVCVWMMCMHLVCVCVCVCVSLVVQTCLVSEPLL